jgi:hypothetical protein
MVNFEILTSNKEVLKTIYEARTIRQRMMYGSYSMIDAELLARRIQLISKSKNSSSIMKLLFI